MQHACVSHLWSSVETTEKLAQQSCFSFATLTCCCQLNTRAHKLEPPQTTTVRSSKRGQCIRTKTNQGSVAESIKVISKVKPLCSELHSYHICWIDVALRDCCSSHGTLHEAVRPILVGRTCRRTRAAGSIISLKQSSEHRNVLQCRQATGYPLDSSPYLFQPELDAWGIVKAEMLRKTQIHNHSQDIIQHHSVKLVQFMITVKNES